MNPRIGVGVLIKHQSKILLGRRKGSHGADSWAYPGGHQDFGEAPEETARREVLEETGLPIHHLKPVFWTNDLFQKRQKHYITLFYEAEADSFEAQLLEPEKCFEWQWFSWDEYPCKLFPTIENQRKSQYKPVFPTRHLGESLSVTESLKEDLPGLIKLLHDDTLGQTRETILDEANYNNAFESLWLDPNQYLLSLKQNQNLIGTLQLSFLPNLTFTGSLRAQIEGVRIKSSRRGEKLGKRFLEAAIDIAKERGAKIIQLTTNKKREESHDFYNSLGFKATHEGFKFYL